MTNQDFIAGSYIKQDDYRVFMPSSINKPFEWKDPEINIWLEKATIQLGELNAYSKLVPDIDFFIHMHVLKEATISSRIEGTQITIDEAVLSRDEIAKEKYHDWQEVQNYTSALNYAIDELNSLPLSMRLLKKIHTILLESVRGEGKDPGQVRNIQVRVGGSSFKTASYVPPPPNKLEGLLTDLEKFLHNDDLNIPNLIKIAIAHYQFEAIHPFKDGNGRIGRLLITLYLIEKELLSRPALYLSDYFDKNRKLYYDSLNLVSKSNNIEQWIKFFLIGVAETSDIGKQTFESIVTLRQQYEENLSVSGKSKAEKGKKLLKLLYSKPTIDVKFVEKELSISTATANSLVKEFVKMGILKEITGYSRNRLFTFRDYLALFKG